jgi:general secretion pathway protein G
MNIKPDTKKLGFTLIELLIVVAIIGILSSIAMVNFMQAQVRAKVSKVKGDMRAISLGIELYAVDFNRYPPAIGTDGTLEHRYSRITTPIDYMSSIPEDPFGDDVEESIINIVGNPHLDYRVYDYISDIDPPTRDTFFVRYDGYGIQQVFNTTIHWYSTSQGPDRILNISKNPPAEYYISYDPTNGTISPGDLYRFGPGGEVK